MHARTLNFYCFEVVGRCICYLAIMCHILRSFSSILLSMSKEMAYSEPSISVVNWFLKNATDTEVLNPVLK
jgi:hypothetical protein